jgi:hypothetical protein
MRSDTELLRGLNYFKLYRLILFLKSNTAYHIQKNERFYISEIFKINTRIADYESSPERIKLIVDLYTQRTKLTKKLNQCRLSFLKTGFKNIYGVSEIIKPLKVKDQPALLKNLYKGKNSYITYHDPQSGVQIHIATSNKSNAQLVKKFSAQQTLTFHVRGFPGCMVCMSAAHVNNLKLIKLCTNLAFLNSKAHKTQGYECMVVHCTLSVETTKVGGLYKFKFLPLPAKFPTLYCLTGTSFKFLIKDCIVHLCTDISNMQFCNSSICINPTNEYLYLRVISPYKTKNYN